DDPQVPRLFRHAGASGSAVDWLRYSHLISAGERLHPRRQLITDFMGYNTWKSHDGRHDLPPENWVGDLILECEVQLEQAEGELVLELSKGRDRFQARWDLATGTCALWRHSDRKEEKLDSKETSLKKPGKYRLRFANVDERLAVWVDSSMPFGDGHDYRPPGLRGPT